MPHPLEQLNAEVVACHRCPRLVAWRELVARQKRRAFASWEYWGKPVPGFGDLNALVGVIGLAPGAHGSNRTGRMFTGDAAGNFLYAALFRAGFASQPESHHMQDGLRLNNLYITSVCRCAPPGNQPTAVEMDNCQTYIERELITLHPTVLVALGRVAFERLLQLLSHRSQGWKFAHGALFQLQDKSWLLCSYHPSRQNTQTGRLTPAMFDAIWDTAKRLVVKS